MTRSHRLQKNWYKNMALRIKKGDTVKVMAGKDKGKTGKVLRVFSLEGKAIIEGLNLYKKHSRPKRQGEKGELVEVQRPLRMPNLMPICPSCGKPTRVGSRKDGEKSMRVCRKCNAEF